MEKPVVHVGRVPKILTDDQLKAGLDYWFSHYGLIRSIVIRRTKRTSHIRYFHPTDQNVFAFVGYYHISSAKAAIANLNRQHLFGRGFVRMPVSQANNLPGSLFRPLQHVCGPCGFLPPWNRPSPPQPQFWWCRPGYSKENNRASSAQPSPPIPQMQQQLVDLRLIAQKQAPEERTPPVAANRYQVLKQVIARHQPPPLPQHQHHQPLPDQVPLEGPFPIPAPGLQLDRPLPQQTRQIPVPQPQEQVQPPEVPQPQEHPQPLLEIPVPTPQENVQPPEEPQPQEHPQPLPQAQEPSTPEWEALYERQLTQEQIIAETLEIFPDIDSSWVAMQAANRLLGELSMYIVENMDTVPKLPKFAKRKAAEPVPTEPEAKKSAFVPEAVLDDWVEAPVDYLSAPLRLKFDSKYRTIVEQRFAFDFQQISLPSLRRVLEAFGYNYAPAYAALHEELAEPVWAERNAQPRQKAVKWNTTRPLRPADTLFTAPVTSLRLLAIRRLFRQEPAVDASLRDEVAWIQRYFAPDQAVTNDAPINEAVDAPKDIAALEECGICVEELEPQSFEECESGHRFCSNCIRTQARETALGLGGGKVVCLEHGCGVEYSRGVLARVLDETLLRQVDEAAGEQALAAAGLDNLVRCKRCNWGAIIDEPPQTAQIFLCRNEECFRSWCRLCDREYDKDHAGKICAEIETDAEAAARKKLEEALTAAVVRRCHRCALPFQKTQGCNKMTCTCGATSCYLCRVPDVNYDHFCGHDLTELNKCTSCTKECALFEDSDKVDQNRLEEVQKNVS